ncbi:hypothetical protein [Leptolyngbya sp. BC1307]|uniref:hypothetical protein n=1 Tax=Leptolyngbya sp. BC1307 TaxID=2029589 RepID=UPI000EFD567F|nr:hypothetical protein [Leptolyngbya sp. BC1307]
MSTEKEAIEHFTRPWAERRGLESMESHSGSILVRASIDELADALTPVAVEARRGVLGTEVESSGCFVLTYQIVGQSWSMILPDEIYDPQHLARCSRPGEADLSAIIGQPVIDFQVSDTVGCIGYQLFEGGERVEYFSGSEEEDPSEGEGENGIEARYYELMPYPDENEDGPLIQMARFWSRDRQLTAEQIGNIWDFPDRFLRDQGAYDPALDSRYFLGDYAPKRGKRYRIQNPGITLVTGRREVTAVPDLVRVDYFRFGS